MSGIHDFPEDWDNGLQHRIVEYCCRDCGLMSGWPDGYHKTRALRCPGCQGSSFRPFGFRLLAPMHIHDREHEGFAGVGDL